MAIKKLYIQLETKLCLLFVRFIQIIKNKSHPSNGYKDYFFWQYNSTEKYFNLFMKHLNFKEKVILDLGCGIGGRTCFYAKQGAKSVYGVDINLEEVKIAQNHTENYFPQLLPIVKYSHANGGTIPLENNSVDLIILFDTFEHLQDPVSLLKECSRVLKSNGAIWIGTIGWFHYHASHITSYIPIPWCQVLFSEKALIEAIKIILKTERMRSDTSWNIKREDDYLRWKDVKDLSQRPGEYLNKLTIRKIRKVIKSIQYFKNKQIRIHGFSGSSIKGTSVLGFLSKIPILDEFFHSYVTITLQK